MKFSIKILAIALVGILMFKNKTQAQVIKLMTYNIRYDNPKDGVNNWQNRKESITTLINHYKPDVFGIQEGMVHQVNYLDSSLTHYTYIGVGRDDGKEKGEFSAIFYNSEKFKAIAHSTFWLSETSTTVSVGWDAALPRICTYVLFEDLNTKQHFWVFNTHFDHVGVKARENSATLIVQKVKEVNKENLPLVVMGDFNSTPESKPVKIISKYLSEASSISQTKPYGPKGTFNGFNMETPVTHKIDYIFVQNLQVISMTHIDDHRKDGYWVSDHLPVMAEVDLNK